MSPIGLVTDGLCRVPVQGVPDVVVALLVVSPGTLPGYMLSRLLYREGRI